LALCAALPSSTGAATATTCPSGNDAIIGPSGQPTPTLTIAGLVATASFKIAPGCSNIQVSLASYETQTNAFSLPQTLIDNAPKPVTTTFGAGGPYTLTTRISPCFYQVDLVLGPVIANLTPTNLYGAAKLVYVNDGTACSAPASCALTGMTAGPPKSIQVTVQNALSGVTSIVPVTNNATVPPLSFTPGTQSPVVVTATKTNQSKGATLELTVTDGAGHVTVCDPTELTVNAGAGSQILKGVPFAESTVSVVGGTVLPSRVDLLVNGRPFVVPVLQKGVLRHVDVSSAMHPGTRNTVVLRAAGRRQATADVIISDAATRLAGS
jgi:hypothetical protein